MCWGRLTAGVQTHSAVISTCERASQWHHALLHFEELDRTRSVLLAGFIHLSKFRWDGCEILNRYIILQLRPAKLLLTFADATAILSSFRTGDCELDVIIFSAAVSSCEKSGRWLSALRLLQSMRRRRIFPNEVTFGAAVAACEKAGEWKFALNFISLAREAGLVGGILARSKTKSRFNWIDSSRYYRFFCDLLCIYIYI